MRPSLDDVMAGRATSQETSIVPTEGDGDRVLAVDIDGAYGAAFQFGVDHRGNWYSNTVYAHLDGGRWQELGSGGTRGNGWETPWSPPAAGWHGEPVLWMGSSGTAVDGPQDEDWDLTAIAGFATPALHAIEVVIGGRLREVPVVSPVGATVVLCVGHQPFTLTPLLIDGRRAQPMVIDRAEDERRPRRLAVEFLGRRIW